MFDAQAWCHVLPLRRRSESFGLTLGAGALLGSQCRRATLKLRVEVRPLSAAALAAQPRICETRGTQCSFGGAWLDYHARLGSVAACELDRAGGCTLSAKFAEARSQLNVQTLVSSMIAW